MKRAPPSPFAFALESFLCFTVAFAEPRRVHWVICAVTFRTRQRFEGCHTSFTAQHDFCSQCCEVDKSASIHLDGLMSSFSVSFVPVRSRRPQFQRVGS